MSAPALRLDLEAMKDIIPPCPTCACVPRPPKVDPPVVGYEHCPTCNYLASVVHPPDDLPEDEPEDESEDKKALARAAKALTPDDPSHPLCASTMALSVALAEEHGPRLDPGRHPLFVLRQLVEEPIAAWPADHLEHDEQWQEAAARARAMRWDDPDSFRDEWPEPVLLPFLLRRYPDIALGQALEGAGWPNTARTRARLRASLEGVPPARRASR